MAAGAFRGGILGFLLKRLSRRAVVLPQPGFSVMAGQYRLHGDGVAAIRYPGWQAPVLQRQPTGEATYRL